MDPYAPINGISLERYAELGAALDGITEAHAQTQKVGELGVAAADWEAAKAGWTARMQDMSLMGQVATRYMQLYNAALAAKGGTASLSFEDWVHVSAGIAVFGYEAAMNQFGLSMGDWTTISAHWQSELSRDPMNLAVRRNQLQEQETQQLRAGGQPRQIHVTRGAAGASAAPAAAPGGGAAYNPNAQAPMQMQGAAPQQPAWGGYAAGAAMGSSLAAGAANLAGAMNGAMDSVLGGGNALGPGRQVKVRWSDGQHYPGTVMQLNGAQAQVAFPDGRQIWVETQYLTPA